DPFAVNVRADVARTIETHDDRIPNFGHEFFSAGRRTWVSSGDGNWADQFAGAGADDVIIIQHFITFDGSASARSVIIESGGMLRFAPDLDTRLDVVNLEVLAGGTLEVGTEAAPVTASAMIVFKDVPLDTAHDPEQFGNGLVALGTVRIHGRAVSDTFVRLAAEPRAGQYTLSLSVPVSGWQVGAHIALPHTHQPPGVEQHGNFADYDPQWETFTIAAISTDGQSITLDHALAFDHLGAHDPDGDLRFLPHVALLSHNVAIRSASSLGTRGHTLFTGRAD